MHDLSAMDVATLQYIQKSMPAAELERADAEGCFDLLKARDTSHLHPKKVVVHGKHGDFIASRMVKDDDAAGTRANGSAKGVSDKSDARPRKAQGRNTKQEKVKGSTAPAKTARRPAKNDTASSSKDSTSAPSGKKPAKRPAKTEREKTATRAHTFLARRYQKLLKDNQRQVSMSCRGNEDDYRSAQMVEAVYQTQQKYGEQAAWDAFAMEPPETVESTVRWEARYWGGHIDDSGERRFVDDAFRAKEIYTHLREMFGTALDESVARDASGFDADAERHVHEMSHKYTDDELKRHFDEKNLQKDFEWLSEEYGDLHREPATFEEAYKLQTDRRTVLRELEAKYCSDSNADESDAIRDRLYKMTGAYRPYVDPNPHKASGTITEPTTHDAIMLNNASPLSAAESCEGAARAANPNRDNPDFAYNCQCCVVAYEARRRGLSVIAGKRTYEHFWKDAFEGDNYTFTMVNRTPDDMQAAVEQRMAAFGDGARAVIQVQWDDVDDDSVHGKAHVFVAEQRNGRTVFLEPQNPKRTPRDVEPVFTRAHFMKITRVDDMPFTALAGERVIAQ